VSDTKNLVIINNEKVFSNENGFFCDNIDLKSIPEGLSKNFNLLAILRTSTNERSHKINLKSIKLANNIFKFLFYIYKTFEKKNTKYLIISITPYTFISYLFLLIFRKKTFLYLRSNGYEEYRAILGFFGPIIYHIMYSVLTFRTKIITCQERLVKKNIKSDLVFPSELNSHWKTNTSKPLLNKPKLLYVGRIKVEKGIFSLINLIKKMNNFCELSIVGKREKENSHNNISYIGNGFNHEELIKIYDEHNIVILPSFTEAHPKVVDEALSRLRPVIIFNDIKHIIGSRKGIFVSERNKNSIENLINYILENYDEIQKNIKTNTLSTKEKFLSDICKIIEK